jgi:ADP-ribosyl-[dinitrogen reductase] hydrolase
MRMLPISFLPYDQIKDASKKYSELTHNSEESLLCSEFYCKLVHELWKEKSNTDGNCNVRFFEDTWIKVEDELKWVIPFKLGTASGYCVDSLNLAYKCIVSSGSFNEAMTRCIQHGNDTDTNSCILGGIAVLVFGMDDVNQNWIDMVKVNNTNPYFAKMFDKAF